jgi:DNA polymerase-4
MERRVAHLDMDAFYASVELLARPALRDLPVVIGGRRAPPAPAGSGHWPRLGDYAGRGVVTTATYEARALGVHSGMGLMRAARLAPEAILLPADFAAYRYWSARFKATVAALAPRIEDRGIDEIYIDLSGDPREPASLGCALRDAVSASTGLSCSIGIAPNKLLAKIASDLDKPGGITVLDRGDLPVRIWPLPAGRINGIGPKAVARLAALGVGTIGELAGTDAAVLQAEFGARYAGWLHDAAHGIDDRPVVTEATRKSFSRETTFERDLHPRHDRTMLGAILTGLCEQLAADLDGRGYAAGVVGIKLRYADFRTVTRELTLPAPTTDAAELLRCARLCLRRVALDRRLRLLGVRAGELERAGGAPRPAQPELPLGDGAGWAARFAVSG